MTTIWQWLTVLENRYSSNIAFRYVEKDVVKSITYAEFVEDVKCCASWICLNFEKKKRINFSKKIGFKIRIRLGFLKKTQMLNASQFQLGRGVICVLSIFSKPCLKSINVKSAWQDTHVSPKQLFILLHSTNVYRLRV